MHAMHTMHTMHTILSTEDPSTFDVAYANLRRHNAGDPNVLAYLRTKDFAHIHKFYCEDPDARQAASVSWYSFMNKPTVHTARAFLEGILGPQVKPTPTPTLTGRTGRTAITTGAGNTRAKRMTKSVGKSTLDTFVALDSLHDLKQMPGLDNPTKMAFANAVYPNQDADAQALKHAFVFAPSTFTQLASDHLKKVFDLTETTRAVTYRVHSTATDRPDYMYGVELLAPLRKAFKKKEIKIVLDSIVFRSKFSYQNSVTAALLLVFIGNEQESFGLYARSHNAPQTIHLLDGEFLDIDSMILLPFVERYMTEVYRLTELHVRFQEVENGYAFYKKYCREDVRLTTCAERNEANASMGTVHTTHNTFPIRFLRHTRMDTAFHPVPGVWSLPYDKKDLRAFVASEWSGSQQASNGPITTHLQDILDINYLRDAYRVDVACMHNALFITHDALSFRYFQWLKKNHASIKTNGILVQVKTWAPRAVIDLSVV